ncbi:hypothetical protein QVN83_21480, partial [Yersinia frederiksenii]|nr:hypothetical protein [Yersinia frederiksenii]
MLKINPYQLCRDTLRFKLLLSTAILSSLTGTAYAGSCILDTPESYICSGAEAAGTDTTQSLTGSPLEVSTSPGFGLMPSTGNALTLIGNGGLSFTDNNASIITGVDGINVTNNGSGALSLISTGTVIGTVEYGIYAYNNLGTDLTIHAVNVIGDMGGIKATNDGTGALSITTTGTVTGTLEYGIYAENNRPLTDLIINVANVTGNTSGILGGNYTGTGALTITATGTVTGTSNFGILAYTGGTDLTINVVDVIGGVDGIYAINEGTGPLSITTSGTVTGTNRAGIIIENLTGPSLLTVAAGSTVQGAAVGINVFASAPVDILNSGTIRNLSALSSALAIQTTGAPGTLTNNGLIEGTVQLSDAGNSVINNASGIWDTAGGTNEFGTLVATNSVLNNGTIIAANG